MKFNSVSVLAFLFLGNYAFAKPTGLNSLLSREEECPPRITVVESCFMCEDRQFERCGEPDETGQRTCFCTTCGYACFLDLVNKREPVAAAIAEPEPVPEPVAEPVAEYDGGVDDVCPPMAAVVQGCSQCKFGFTNRLACQQGSTGLECRCDVCFNICTFDGPTKREPEPEPSTLDQCSQLPFVDSCSRCPFGFDASTCQPGSSGPRECKCTLCGNACQDNSQKKRAPVPPPELICPAEGSPIQSCGLCGAGSDRCNASTGLCQCRFCDGPSSFCKSSPQ